jgi:hypothetical protein
MRGVERYIKFNGGAPAFNVVVDTVVAACCTDGGGPRLLRDLDGVGSKFADYPLTRDFASAAETIGLTAISEGCRLSRQDVAERLLIHLGQRHCDGMLDYVVRHRTREFVTGRSAVESYKSKLGQASFTPDLAARMRNCSPKGLPARAPKAPPVTHTAEGLNEEI